MSLTELGTTPGKVETLFSDVPYIADPLNAFAQLTQDLHHCILLESAEIDSKHDLQSLILLDTAVKLECKGQRVDCQALSANGHPVISLLE